jgi:hypothetical protein
MFQTWKSKTHQGINLGRNSFFNSLLYADDKVIIQNSEYEWQRVIFELNKIVDIILEQVSHFKYLGSDISYENNKDIDEKVAKFRHICGLIHRNLKK